MPKRKARHNNPRDNEPREFIDYVARKTKPTVVPQETGEWPPFAIIIATMFTSRRPKAEIGLTQLLFKEFANFEPEIGHKPHGTELCTCCNQYVRVSSFRADTRKRNGLHSHCKFCEAEHKRQIYWHQKHTGLQPRAA